MSNNDYNFDADKDSQEYDFWNMSVPVAPISYEDLLFGPGSQMDFATGKQDTPIDYSAIEPIPYNQPTSVVYLDNPVCSKEHFQDFEHESDLSRSMPYAAHDEALALKFMSRIERDFAKIQCESDNVRGMLQTTYANPYANLFDISVQEQEHNDDDKHLYRYSSGRKDDVYSSIWYRNLIGGNERDGGERYCAPCNQWHNTRNHAWANHKTSVHGISAVTKSLYPFPSGVILDKKSSKLKGKCSKCQKFVPLYIKKVGTVWTTWFRHQDAHIRKEMQDRRGGKIVTPNNPRNSKKRKIEAVEVEVPQSSVNVAASNIVLEEFFNKKQCFEVSTESEILVQDFSFLDQVLDQGVSFDQDTLDKEVFLDQDTSLDQGFSFDQGQATQFDEIQASHDEIQAEIEDIPVVDFFPQSYENQMPDLSQPVEAEIPDSTEITSSSPDADYSVEQVEDMMDLLEMEMDITMELDQSDNEDSSENNETPEQKNTVESNTSLEDEGEDDSKFNPLDGEFELYSDLFGDF
ncbi:hypothetical protein CJU90_1806 [Yarrowia sp. C11]|nr:hypothetical protein CKK34_5834 [Yarrowia sp. E02]KAG5371745.1 hypothetical protein CJU90_1806 [Yarrowia sp. C11]